MVAEFEGEHNHLLLEAMSLTGHRHWESTPCADCGRYILLLLEHDYPEDYALFVLQQRLRIAEYQAIVARFAAFQPVFVSYRYGRNKRR